MEELRKMIEMAREAERERAAMICWQYRDVEYPAAEIAERILHGQTKTLRRDADKGFQS